MGYTYMVYLLSQTEILNQSIRLLLLDRLGQGGTLSREDWLLYIQHVTFLPNPAIPKATAISWLANKCAYNAIELKAILESVKFLDGTQPTIILSQTGDIIIAE